MRSATLFIERVEDYAIIIGEETIRTNLSLQTASCEDVDDNTADVIEPPVHWTQCPCCYEEYEISVEVYVFKAACGHAVCRACIMKDKNLTRPCAPRNQIVSRASWCQVPAVSLLLRAEEAGH